MMVNVDVAQTRITESTTPREQADIQHGMGPWQRLDSVLCFENRETRRCSNLHADKDSISNHVLTGMLTFEKTILVWIEHISVQAQQEHAAGSHD
jgi:hypothetical protein